MTVSNSSVQVARAATFSQSITVGSLGSADGTAGSVSGSGLTLA
eukprot:COSAG01_NODE_79345_length_132_cov_200.151515_1_plen_43_part_11